MVVKLMETELPWTGPSLKGKVVLSVMVEAGEALEAQVVAENTMMD
jgi:hypothetical protein